jgi:hypothetical protein
MLETHQVGISMTGISPFPEVATALPYRTGCEEVLLLSFTVILGVHS